ncbi:HK97-gp10 family putative phage morphogenesis protein [Siminovitchia sp. FSL W7-1587]|uniref:HK97-gp10 family putative phage morphogenesis protein n=1 Tax=Siminovitchia sp. FSL W7-1587 TaxID=2954699 RepID=UPI0030CBFA42
MQFRGADQLIGALKKKATLNDVKEVVKLNGSELQRGMMRKASFTRGYQTGTTKRSIKLKFADGGFAVKVGPGTEYSPYLEHGTRFMAAQPFVGPAYHQQKQKFLKDMKRLME